MIARAEDKDGKIIGFIEWRQVGQSGFDKYQGEYVWINDFWIHDDYRSKEVFKELVEKVLNSSHPSKFCYWRRRKYNGRVSKLYTREHFERLVEKGIMRWVETQ